MIKHIVMWRLKTEYSDAEREEAIRVIKEALEALPALISEIIDFEVGVNTLHSERSSDIVLYSSFASLDDLKAYQVHPDHKAVIPIIQERTSEGRVVDY